MVWLICSAAAAVEHDVEQLRNKAIAKYGESWVKEIESWADTLQTKTPVILPFSPQEGRKNSLDPKALVDRFVNFSNKNATTAVAINPEVFIFVSTSMPSQSLQQWALQAEKIQAPLLLRGFINNSLKETIQVTQEIFGSQDVGGFSIDPEKFTLYDIQKVPAVVVSFTPSCGTDSCPPPEYDVVYGNIGLEEALELIAAKGSTDGQKYAKELLHAV
jgi:conjugal transfer pilus assembly protein TrbC